MAEDDLFIAGSNFELQNERIQHLFGVEISVTSDEDVLLEGRWRYNNAKVRFKSSSNSAKAESKAQKYLQAVLGESEDFIKKILVLGEADFNMVLSEKDNIEKLFQIYCYSVGKTQICLQGNRGCVTRAYRYINSSMSRKSELWDTQDPHEDKNSINRELENLQLNENVTLVDLSARGGQVARYLSDFKEVDDSLLFGGDIETDSCFSPTQIQDTANWRAGRDRSNNSSPENETDRILSDPDHSNNVEKALKLGYSEEQIVTVLRKLGTTAPSVEFNSLLSELIKEGATSPDSGINSAPFLSDTSDNNDVILPENADDSSNLKPIVIDGSNVAMSHGYKEVFSCRGIQIAVDYFRQRGHKKITVFVPQWRKESSRPGAQIKDQEIMKQLEKDKILVFTPSRRIAGKRIVCYDDRFILDLAHDKNGIVVSNDNYRDLHNEKALYKKVAEEQLLPYVFAEDKFMPPEDPLGKHGPTLDNFLRIKPVVTEPLQPCPYGKKCTYGNKCRFAHPERGNRPQRSVTDILTEQSDQKIKDRAVRLEEKKKKEKTKQLLKRTKSLFPDEPCSSIEMKTTRFYNKSESVDESKDYKLSRDKGNKSDINAILDEHRKRLSEQIKSREASPVPTFDIQKVSNQSSDNIVHIEPQITELQPFVSTLSTPQFSTQTSEATQSDNHRGVIQLVKKLSDEANNESFFVNDRNQSSSNVTTQSSQPKTSWTQTRSHSQSQELPPQSRFASLPYISSQQLATGHNSPSYPSHSDTGRYYSVPATSTRQNAMIDWPRGFIGGGGNQGYHNTVGGNQGYHNTVGGNQGYHNTVGGNQGYHNTVGGNQGYQNTVGGNQGYQNTVGGNQGYHNTVGGNQGYHNRVCGNQGYQNTVGYMDSVYRYPPNTVLDNRAVYPDQIHNPNQILRQNSYSDAQLQALQDQEQARMQNLHNRGANNRNVPVGGQMMRQTSGITSPPIQPPSPYLASGYYSPSDYQSPIPSNMWQPPPQAPYQQPVYLPTSPPYMPPVSYPEDAEILSSDSRYSTYYQLSNLFPEPKVRAVMNKHPNERDPKELCKLLCL